MPKPSRVPRKIGSLLPLIAVPLFLSCWNNEVYVEKSPQSTSVKYQLDTFTSVISITDKQQPFYKVFSANKDGIYCGYNDKGGNLDIFSLNEARFLKAVQLPLDPLESKAVKSIYMQNSNSFYILTQTKILHVDSQGIALKKIGINNHKPFFKENYLMEIDAGRNFTYNARDNRIYITTYNPKEGPSKKQFKLPFVVTVNPDDSEDMKQLPVYYSPLYRENNYGFLSAPQFSLTFNNSKILYNFPIEPNIYEYDIKTKITKIHGGKPVSKATENRTLARPFNEEDEKNSDKKMSHLLTNIYYFPVIGDPDNRLIYRAFHYPKKEVTNSQYNDINANERYLAVFDSQFRTVVTIHLGDRPYFLFGQFVTNEGFYLPCGTKPNTLRFKRFKVKLL